MRKPRARKASTLLETYEFLIPIEENKTGILHPQQLFDEWELETARKFSGLTRVGHVHGWWPDEGRLIPDESSGYLLAIKSTQFAELTDHLEAAAVTFKQKCLFLEHRGQARFVPETQPSVPAPSSGFVAAEAQLEYGTHAKGAHQGLFLQEIRARIERDEPYLDVLEFALGRRSPLLRGAAIATAEVQRDSAYRMAREMVTAYGVRLQLLRAQTANDALSVREATVEYGRSPSQPCVSQIRAAILLGATI